MTKLLDLAIEAASQLPPEQQDELARTIFEIVNSGKSSVYVLSKDEKAAIAVARAQVARGEFATEEEIEAIFKKYAS